MYMLEKKKMSPLKDVYILILQIYKYVTFHGKSNSADETKLMISMEDYPGLSMWAQCNPKHP